MIKKGMVFDCFLQDHLEESGRETKLYVVVQSIKNSSDQQTAVVCPIVPATQASNGIGNVTFSRDGSEWVILVSQPITVATQELSTPLYVLEASTIQEINKSLKLVYGVQPVQVVKVDSILNVKRRIDTSLQIAKQELLTEIQSVKQEVAAAMQFKQGNAVSMVPTRFSFSIDVEPTKQEQQKPEQEPKLSQQELSELKQESSELGQTLSKQEQTSSEPEQEPAKQEQTSSDLEQEEPVSDELRNLARYLAGETDYIEEPKQSSVAMEDKPRKKKKEMKPRMQWTNAKIEEFLEDCDTIPTYAVAEKWNMSIQSVYATRSRFKKMRTERSDQSGIE